ncbi:hypothetical protein [Candidatus Solirubrobacter pratensis]|uniref:hypothetical protein n=1 Tax=Candidatus Solirubrobacter pratensis TaxID=1298857 RepID=UPI0003FFCD19|nr:hypothetical protein [Candidatus Solirubrobacter pratensis]
MTAALTPALALAYLHELSADIRAAIVLDAAGNRLAGPEPLAAPARALLAEGPLVGSIGDRGGAFGARDERHGVVAVTGPFALPRVVRHDLARVLAALAPAPDEPGDGSAPSGAGVPDATLDGAPEPVSTPAASAAAETLLNAL